MANYPWKASGQVTCAIYILVGTYHISIMAVARVVEFCMHVGYVKSQHKDDKWPFKGAWSWSHDPLYILMPPMISLERLKQKLSNIAARYTVSNPSLRWQTTPKRGVVRDTWLGMLKSFFSWYSILRSKNSIFSIIIYQPMWETGFDGRQVRLCVVNTLKKRLVVPSAPRPCDSLAVSAAALVHSSNSHCLAHTTFSMPNSRPGYRGSTTVATTYRRSSVTSRQSRHQKASRRRHATWWSNW